MTREYVDLDARLRNAQNTEQRLATLQRERTGKLSDVLAVETEIGRVRGEIERMEAQRRSLATQVELATVHVALTEDYKTHVSVIPDSTGGRLRNAAVDGYRSVTESLIDGGELILAWGPRALLWSLLLFWPVRAVWKRYFFEK